MKKDLIILAGGTGSRIKNITKKIPKPLIEINKKPFLDIILRNFARYDFENIYILGGYKGYKILNRYNNKIINFVKIQCFIEKKKLDTWGAVESISNKIKNDFLLVNGDSFLLEDFDYFLDFKDHQNYLIKLMLVKNSSYKSNSKLSNLYLYKNLIQFKKSSNYMNGGIYFIKKKILNNEFKNDSSIENDVIKKLIKRKKVAGKYSNKFFIDIGTYKNLSIAKKEIPKILRRPAVFLDRDGVINHDYGYTHKWKNFKIKKNVLRALKFLNENNILIFIVTNQAGIGKGIFKEEDFFDLHKKFKNYLSKKNIYINDVKFCPYHPDAKIKKYRKRTNFRKPGNLMIKEILKQWDIIKETSIMIGDKNTDLLAAKKSRIYFEYDKNNLHKQLKKFFKRFNLE